MEAPARPAFHRRSFQRVPGTTGALAGTEDGVAWVELGDTVLCDPGACPQSLQHTARWLIAPAAAKPAFLTAGTDDEGHFILTAGAEAAVTSRRPDRRSLPSSTGEAAAAHPSSRPRPTASPCGGKP